MNSRLPFLQGCRRLLQREVVWGEFIRFWQLGDIGQGAEARRYGAAAREKLTIPPRGLRHVRFTDLLRRAKHQHVCGVHGNLLHVCGPHVKACRDNGSLLVVAAVVSILAPEWLEEQPVLTRAELLEE